MDQWNNYFGDWVGLGSIAQIPRYARIASHIERLCPEGANVLDIGCGEAWLREHLRGPRAYMGLEPSSEAITLARKRRSDLCLVNSTAESFEAGPEQRWNCIVFNEVLYYCVHPVRMLRKYAAHLDRGGVMIISIFQKKRSLKDLLLESLPFCAMSNMRCTKLVHRFLVNSAWHIECDEFIECPGRQCSWRIISTSPGHSIPSC